MQWPIQFKKKNPINFNDKSMSLLAPHTQQNIEDDLDRGRNKIWYHHHCLSQLFKDDFIKSHSPCMPIEPFCASSIQVILGLPILFPTSLHIKVYEALYDK